MKFLIAQRQLDAFHQDNVPMASLRVMYSVSYVSLRFVFEEALHVSFNTSCIAFPVIRTEHFRGKELVGSYVMRKSSQKKHLRCSGSCHNNDNKHKSNMSICLLHVLSVRDLVPNRCRRVRYPKVFVCSPLGSQAFPPMDHSRP